MKMLVLLEVDVPKAIGETMQRTGFSLVPDGTSLQVKVDNSPPIPQRKTKVVFVTNPNHSHQDLLKFLATDSTPPSTTEATPESK